MEKTQTELVNLCVNNCCPQLRFGGEKVALVEGDTQIELTTEQIENMLGELVSRGYRVPTILGV